jgi:hypothetical protein
MRIRNPGFNIEAYYRNKTKTSAYYLNESRTFQSVPKLFKIESECFGEFLKFKNETRMKPS